MYRLVLLALLLLSTACDGALRDPVGVGGGVPGGGTGGGGGNGGGGGDGNGGGGNGGGGGGGGGGNNNSLIVGTWKAQFIIQLSNDIQRQTTIWTFGSNATCRRTVETYSVLADQTFTSQVDCTFTTGNGQVAITYQGNTSPVTFRWSLDGFSRLELDGVVYDRIG